MTTTTLPDSDLHTLFTLLEEARRDDPDEIVPWRLLEGLGRLVHADSVQLTELDWVDESVPQQQFLELGGERVVVGSVLKDENTSAYFEACRDFVGCDPTRPEEFRLALRWSDFLSDRQLRDTRAMQDYFWPDVFRCLGVRLPSPPGRARRIVFMRAPGSDFTDRDVELLTLLRPHLHEIYLDAERRRHGVPRLTPREWEILQLAGEGLPNNAIGQRLFISPATVRKHMEHIFDTVGVRSRTEAAAIALPHRPLRSSA